MLASTCPIGEKDDFDDLGEVVHSPLVASGLEATRVWYEHFSPADQFPKGTAVLGIAEPLQEPAGTRICNGDDGKDAEPSRRHRAPSESRPARHRRVKKGTGPNAIKLSHFRTILVLKSAGNQAISAT